MFKVTPAAVVDSYLIRDLLPCFDPEISRDEVAKKIAAGDTGFTFWANGEVIGVMGGTKTGPQVMYGWSILGEAIKKHRFSFTKKMREFIDLTLTRPDVHRFFVTIDVGNEPAIRQNKWMGLELEGVMRKSGMKGQDQVLMAKVRN
jgi:RimJ/RimL family protein N-acetyltransferase